MIDGHRTADRAVPAVGRGNAKSAFCAEKDRVARRVDIHCPSNAKIENDTALQANKRTGKIVHTEMLGYLFGALNARIPFRRCTEIRRGEAGNREWLRIADCV